MARKITEDEAYSEKLILRIKKTDMERIIKLAEYCEVSKTQMGRNLLLAGIEQTEILKNTGALGIAKGIIKGGDFLKKWNEVKKTSKQI